MSFESVSQYVGDDYSYEGLQSDDIIYGHYSDENSPCLSTCNYPTDEAYIDYSYPDPAHDFQINVHDITVGEQVEAQWGELWYPGVLVEVVGSEGRIQFDDFPEEMINLYYIRRKVDVQVPISFSEGTVNYRSEEYGHNQGTYGGSYQSYQGHIGNGLVSTDPNSYGLSYNSRCHYQSSLYEQPYQSGGDINALNENEQSIEATTKTVFGIILPSRSVRKSFLWYLCIFIAFCILAVVGKMNFEPSHSVDVVDIVDKSYDDDHAVKTTDDISDGDSPLYQVDDENSVITNSYDDDIQNRNDGESPEIDDGENDANDDIAVLSRDDVIDGNDDHVSVSTDDGDDDTESVSTSSVKPHIILIVADDLAWNSVGNG